MVKIVFQIVMGLVNIWIIEYLCEIIYKKTELYKSGLGDIRKFVEGIPENLEIVNVGSGPGVYAINYDYAPVKGFNLSTAPQSFEYGFQILKKYSNKIKENAIIIIIMCPLSFGNNNSYDKKNYSDKYYYFLDKNQIYNFSVIKKWLLIRHPLAKRSIGKLLRGFRRLVCKNNAKKESVKSMVQVWKEEFDLYDLKDSKQADKHKKAFENKINVLDKEIEYCREQLWKPVLFIPPIPPKTKEQIGEDFLTEFVWRNIEKLTSKVGEIDIYNYYYDSEFEKEDFYFNDIFMNEKGQKILSKKLFDEIYDKGNS